jgi:hypothetical protein
MQLDLFNSDKDGPKKVSASAKPTVDWMAAYRDHLKSANWKKLRKAKLAEAHGLCQRCGSGSGRREVHHKSYERLGNERLDDLIVLCPECHAFEDKIRAKQGETRSRQAREAAVYNNGLNTYMMKKYGEGGGDGEEYHEWLERKRESGGDY